MKTKFFAVMAIAFILAPALCVCFSDTAYAAPGDITTVAGTGTSGYNGDTYLLATSTALNNPSSICKDSSGRIFIADRYNNRIRMIDTSGNIYTVAGTGAAAYGGDGGAATSAQLNQPIGIYADLSGNIFVAELLSHRIHPHVHSGRQYQHGCRNRSSHLWRRRRSGNSGAVEFPCQRLWGFIRQYLCR